MAEADKTVLSILSFPNKWVFCSLTRFSYSLVKEKKSGLNLVLNPARAQSCRCCAGSSYAMMKGPPHNGLSGFKSSSSELKQSIINHCKEKGASRPHRGLFHINAGHSLKRRDLYKGATCSVSPQRSKSAKPAQDKSTSAFLPSETSQSRSDALRSEEQPCASQLLFVVGVCVSAPVRKNQRSFPVLEVSACS